MALRLIDAHVHLWDTNRRRYAWLDEFPSIDRPFGLSDFDLVRGDVEVEKIVFVECAGAAEAVTARDEVVWVENLASEDSRIAGIVAFAPLETGEEAGDHVEWLSSRPLVRGVRRLLQGESDPRFCLSDGFIEGIQLLESFDLSFDACIYHFQLESVIRLVERCPNARIVLDHLGKPAIRDARMDPWSEHLQVLATFPNVFCKISGALTEADHTGWKESEIIPFIEVAIDAFGDHRIMFGGDWPVLNLAGSYADWLNVVRNTLMHFSELSTHRFFVENAAGFYRLNDD